MTRHDDEYTHKPDGILLFTKNTQNAVNARFDDCHLYVFIYTRVVKTYIYILVGI